MLLQIEKLACLVISSFVCTCISYSMMPGLMYPYVVYLLNKENGFMCAGTIINKQFILTPATCVYARRSQKIRMLLTNGNTIHVESIKFHEGFKAVSEGKVSNDIAILKTKTDIPSVSFTKLPSKDFSIGAATENYVVNWIKKPTVTDGLTTKVFRQTSVAVYNNETCSSIEDKYNDMTKNFCFVPVSELDKEKKKCASYSGGPVIFSNTQIGIIVKSSHFCFFNNKFPKIAIMVAPYVDWINKNSIYTARKIIIKDKTTKKRKKSNASSFRAFFLVKTVAFCVTVSLFKL